MAVTVVVGFSAYCLVLVWFVSMFGVSGRG